MVRGVETEAAPGCGICRAVLDAKATKLEAEDAAVRAAMNQRRIDMDARSATCDALERNMETAHLETEQLLAQQVRCLEPYDLKNKAAASTAGPLL